MSALFLSASVPVAGRGNFYDTADPFLIQVAVRELMLTVLGRRLVIWGGHPAITPMVWTVCEDLDVDFSKAVVLYQSKFFKDFFPEENKRFANVKYVDEVKNDRDASLLRMREAMLSRDDLAAAVFIGGMEGIVAEHELFTRFHPEAKVLAVPAPGGAARELASKLGVTNEAELQNVDFAKLFHEELKIAPDEPRTTTF
jgi:SLOG cluster3 family